MAQSRDQQEVTLVIVQKPGSAQSKQEVVLVLGPAMTIAPTVSKKRPQVAVIS